MSFPMAAGLPGRDPDEEAVVRLRAWNVVLVHPAVGAHTLRVVAHFEEQMDNGLLSFDPGTYEVIASFTMEASGPPETGGTTPMGLLPLWLAVGGGLVLTLGLALPRLANGAR